MLACCITNQISSKSWLKKANDSSLTLPTDGKIADAELLAIFLRVGVKGKSAVALAEDLLHRFGSLPRLLACSPEEFIQVHGMGLSKWSQIQAAYELEFSLT